MQGNCPYCTKGILNIVYLMAQRYLKLIILEFSILEDGVEAASVFIDLLGVEPVDFLLYKLTDREQYF